MIRFFAILSVALSIAVSATAEERDIHDYLLDMFRAQVASLTDFDADICGAVGTLELRSTNGVWSCESPTTLDGATINSMTEAMMDTLSMSDGDVDQANAQHVHAELLFVYSGTLDADDECLYPQFNNLSNVLTVVCSNVAMPVIAPKAFYVTEIAVAVEIASTAGYGCIVQPTVDDIDAGTPLTMSTDMAASTSERQTTGFAVAEDAELKIQVLDGAGALVCDAGTNPRLAVSVFGYWTN